MYYEKLSAHTCAVGDHDYYTHIRRFSSFLQQYCILLQEVISTFAVIKMAAHRVSGSNNKTVTVQVLASNTLSAYSTTSVRPEVRSSTFSTTTSIDHTAVNRVSF